MLPEKTPKRGIQGFSWRRIGLSPLKRVKFREFGLILPAELPVSSE
jgi:hypothetical protein